MKRFPPWLAAGLWLVVLATDATAATKRKSSTSGRSNTRPAPTPTVVTGAAGPGALAALPAVGPTTVPTTRAAAVVVVDADRRRIIHAKNADEIRPAASTQKLLTALVVIETGDLDRRVTILPEDTRAEPVKLYFKAGDVYTRAELLEALLVHSMNDAAVALARDNAGSIAAFAARMNRKAAQLGMSQSQFVNPNGLPADGQFSTARDLARLALAAYETPIIRAIVKKEQMVFHYSDGRVRTYANTNKLLGRVQYCNGMKTGYTNSAGKCLIASGRAGTRDAIVVLLGDSPSAIWQDASALLAWALSS